MTPRHFVISFRTGRLANRLVLFANFIGFARDQGHRISNFAFHSYASFFRSTRADLYCQYPPPARRSVLDVIPGVAPALRGTRLLYRLAHAAARWNERVPIPGWVTLREAPGLPLTPLDGPQVNEQLARGRLVFVEGWTFRAPACVQQHAAAIRAYFQLAEPHAEASRQATAALRSRADVLIGVHIRQGDYRQWKGGRFCYSVERYVAWMRQLAAQLPGRRTAFLVCSDEPRNAAEFPGLAVGFGPGVPVQDLYALAGCDYVFGPPSTFSQWASFQGNQPLWQPKGAEVEAVLGNFQVSWLAEVP